MKLKTKKRAGYALMIACWCLMLGRLTTTQEATKLEEPQVFLETPHEEIAVPDTEVTEADLVGQSVIMELPVKSKYRKRR